MFGIVTKRQLDRHAEELRAEVEAARRDIDALKFEWNSMYDKFRTMLARWVKRDKDNQAEPGGDGVVTGTEESTSSRPVPFPRSRRGF